MTNNHPQVMLITGGTGSIGGEVADQALAAGWAVVVQGSSDRSVSAWVEKLSDKYPGAVVKGVAIDIKAEGAVQRLVDQVGAYLNRIDAIVDCVVTGRWRSRRSV